MFKRFSAGFATGYVLGARAGEKRYEQMSDLAGRAMDLPVVKQLSDRASGLLTSENSKQIVQAVMERAKAGFSPSERPTKRGSSSSDDGAEDFDDEDDSDAYAEDDEDWDDDQADDDRGEDDQADDDQDADDRDDEQEEDDRGDDAPRSSRNGNGRKPRADEGRGGQRGAIRSLAAAARERGRVD